MKRYGPLDESEVKITKAHVPKANRHKQELCIFVVVTPILLVSNGNSERNRSHFWRALRGPLKRETPK